jgi:hypothetical protein
VRSGDTGASLVLVLIIITVIALVMGAVLAETDSNLRTTFAVRDEAGSAYGGDGAAQAAINDIRNGYGYIGGSVFTNAVNSSCFGPTSSQGTLALRDFYPAIDGQKRSATSSASVVCTGENGTGAQGPPVIIKDDNRPAQAILTLGTNPSEDGINVKAQAKDPGNVLVPFNVHGSIVSDSNINVSAGSLVASGAVTAHTGCTGAITSTPAKVCDAATTVDPLYATEAGILPYQAVPTTCPGKLVTFNPGYYDDAVSLSNLMNGTGSCKGSVWWFTPGSYYFDFHNDPSVDLPGLPKGDHLWTIKDSSSQLVGGTPCATRVFPDPINSPNNPPCTQIAKPIVPAVVPGACVFPTEALSAQIAKTSTPGVQFIFGGDSQLRLDAGDVEICGSYASNHVAPSLIGLQTGSATLTPQAGLKLTTVVSRGSYKTPSATVTNLSDPDGAFATWNSTAKSDSTTLTVDGFAPASIPAGSTFKSATVQIRHRHSDTTALDATSVVVTPRTAAGLGTALPAATTSGRLGSATFVTDPIPVDTTLTGSLAAAIHAGTLTGAQVAVTTTLPNAAKNDNEDIDSIQLDISYYPPAYRAETTATVPGNCLAQTYTGIGGSGCAVLSTKDSFAGAFYMDGTTYTPIAAVDFTLNNITQQVMRFGLISRTLFIKETGSLAYSGPVIFLPDITGQGIAGTIVDLSVYVCVGVSTANCSTDSSRKLQLKARVLINDPSNPPVVGKRQIVVLSWSMQR